MCTVKRRDKSFKYTKRHFHSLNHRYGAAVLCLSLVRVRLWLLLVFVGCPLAISLTPLIVAQAHERTPKEQLLATEFQAAVAALQAAASDELPAISYLTFDFLHHSKTLYSSTHAAQNHALPPSVLTLPPLLPLLFPPQWLH